MRKHALWTASVMVVSLCAGLVRAEGSVELTGAIADPERQQDFPSVALGPGGEPWVAYVAFDGRRDRLMLGRKRGDGMATVGTLAGPGWIHHPRLARDGSGTLWAVWSQRSGAGTWELLARRVENGEPAERTVTLAGGKGSHVFADAARDRRGRVWVVWQSFRGGNSDVYLRRLDPAANTWSEAVRVSDGTGGGAWMPRLAFGKADEAWVVFDEAVDREFDVKVAVVQPSGEKTIFPVAASDAYQGAAAIAATPDGTGFYVAWERGHKRWGKDARGTNWGASRRFALNTDKHLESAYVDAGSKEVRRLPCAKPVVASVAGVGKQVRRLAVNRPTIGVDGDGRPWMACRYAIAKGGWGKNRYWRTVLTRYDPEKDQWSAPVELPKSTLSQDRVCELVRGRNGKLWAAWPSDRRNTSDPGMAGVYVARVGAGSVSYPKEAPTFPDPELGPRQDPAKNTPLRPRDDRHTVRFGEKTYRLYWGDFHRHTDLSADQTIWDGSVVEQFRYAYEVGALDFLGTSDHTDIGPGHYTNYEWWRTQKLASVFQNAGHFLGFFAYEREQSWPWGHRNVVFAEPGGPVVYIDRSTYRASRWAERYPVGDGGEEIPPQQLWEILGSTGKPVTVLSHTPGNPGQGTNWALYDRIDHGVENLVEIYQGKRVSYEAMDAPQPRVALPPGKHGTAYGRRTAKGMYQKALKQGLRLGIFASSDHLSTHVSFGGVYAPEFTRKSIIDAMNDRRTVGATDKIFLHYTCNGHPLGEAFETAEPPKLRIHAEGTAPIRKLTVLRNGKAHKTYEPGKKKVTVTHTDDAPAEGVNRYYVRLQQEDGNMAWASPVWVTYRP